MTTVINVFDITGRVAATQKAGQTVFDRVVAEFALGHSVILDFEGVDIAPSIFWNYAIGQLVRDYDLERLHSDLNFLGLTGDQGWVLGVVIENAKKFYSRG